MRYAALHVAPVRTGPRTPRLAAGRRIFGCVRTWSWCGWPWVYTPDEGSVKVSGGGHRQGWEHGVVSENHEVVTNAHHP